MAFNLERARQYYSDDEIVDALAKKHGDAVRRASQYYSLDEIVARINQKQQQPQPQPQSQPQQGPQVKSESETVVSGGLPGSKASMGGIRQVTPEDIAPQPAVQSSTAVAPAPVEGESFSPRAKQRQMEPEGMAPAVSTAVAPQYTEEEPSILEPDIGERATAIPKALAVGTGDLAESAAYSGDYLARRLKTPLTMTEEKQGYPMPGLASAYGISAEEEPEEIALATARPKQYEEMTPEERKRAYSPTALRRLGTKIAQSVPEQWRKDVAEISGEGLGLGRLAENPLGWLSTALTMTAENIPLVASQAITSVAGNVVLPGLGTVTGGGSMMAFETGRFLKLAEQIAQTQDFASLKPGKKTALSAEQQQRWQSIVDELALIYGVASGAIEYLGNLFGPLGALKSGLKGTAKPVIKEVLKRVTGIVGEGVEELSQEGLMNVLMGKAIERMKEIDPTFAPDWKPGDLAKAGYEGIVVSGMLSALGLSGGRVGRVAAEATESALESFGRLGTTQTGTKQKSGAGGQQEQQEQQQEEEQTGKAKKRLAASLAKRFKVRPAEIDEGTMLPGRNATRNRVNRALNENQNQQTPKRTILFMDIDHFKPQNEIFGHDAADGILEGMGYLIDEIFGDQAEFYGRQGGEEFAVILPAGSEDVAQQFINAVGTRLMIYGYPVTFSAGMSGARSASGEMMADKLLRQAKQTGRNRIVVDRPGSEPYTIVGPDVGRKPYVSAYSRRSAAESHEEMASEPGVSPEEVQHHRQEAEKLRGEYEQRVEQLREETAGRSVLSSEIRESLAGRVQKLRSGRKRYNRRTTGGRTDQGEGGKTRRTSRPRPAHETAGAVNLEAFSRIPGAIRRVVQKWLVSGGHTPKSVQQLDVARIGRLNAIARKAGFAAAEMHRVFKDAYGTTNLPDEVLEQVDAAIKGDSDIESLPDAIRASARKFRDHIDALTREAMRSGVIPETMKATVKKHIGVHVRRAYQIHNDPKWRKKIPADVRNAAHAYLLSELESARQVAIENAEQRLDKLASMKAQLQHKLETPVSPAEKQRIGELLGTLRAEIEKIEKALPMAETEVASQLQEMGGELAQLKEKAKHPVGSEQPDEFRNVDEEREAQSIQNKIRALEKRINQTASKNKATQLSVRRDELVRQYRDLTAKATKEYSGAEITALEDKIADVDALIERVAAKLSERQAESFSSEQIEGMLNAFLNKHEGIYDSIDKASRLGAKNLSSLMRRKGIPVEIRNLMGEYRDPITNYVNTIAHQSQLIVNHQFLTQVRELGLQEGWLKEKPVTNEDGDYSYLAAPKTSATMKPLSGLYTTRDIAEELEGAMTEKAAHPLMRHYMKAVGLVKYAKTVGSVQTHVRNFFANPFISVAAGHWDARKTWQAAQAIWGDLANTSDEELQDYINHLIELGVVGDNARAGELRAVFRDAFGNDWESFVDSRLKRITRTIPKAMAKAYQVEDDFWKIYGFENEKSLLSSVYSDMPKTELEKMAAKNVRRIYPYYSQVPRLVKEMRKVPLIGPFMSFSAEIIRGSASLAMLTGEELKDPQTRAIGARRLAGITLVVGVPAAVSLVTRMASKITPDEEKDIRLFLPPWSQNSQIVWLGSPELGKFKYVDFGYTDPYTYVKSPFIAFMRGEDVEETALKTLGEAFSPFISEDILTSKLLDLSRNMSREGRQIYNPTDDLEGKMVAVFKHFAEAIEPGTISSFRRLFYGIIGKEVNVYGKKYNPKIEAMATGLGLRISEIDVATALGFKAGELSKSLVNVGRIGTVRGKDAQAKAYRRVLDNFYPLIRAARRLGLDDKQISLVLKQNAVNKTVMGAMVKDTYEENKGEIIDALVARSGASRTRRLETRKAMEKRIREAKAQSVK